jgi:hypothetical protein
MALRYNPEGRGFDPFIDIILPAALCSTHPLTEEYQEYFLEGKDGWCVGLTTFMFRLS